MNVGRPLQYDPEIVLASAMSVFWKQGYCATSLDDLLNAMNLSKSSFYQAYKSKHALFLNCLSHYLKLTSDELQVVLTKSESGKKIIIDIFDMVIQDGAKNPCGCLISNTANEFAQTDAQITKLIKKSLNTYKRIFKRAVEKGQNDGSINEDIDPECLAAYLVTSLSGLRTMVKAGIDQKTLRGMVRMIENTIQ